MGVRIMPKAVWAVVPDLRPWLDDMRRNSQPYFYGKSMSGTEMQFANYVKHELQKRGIRCYVDLVESTAF